MVTLGDVKAKLSDNSVVASAQSPTDLAKPPSIASEAGKSVGIGVAGTLAGAMLFPPLALVASAFSLVSSVGGSDRWSKRLERIRASTLRTESVAPGTSTSGYVYVPALTNQTGLIAFYTVAGNVESLTLNRGAN